MAGKPIPVEVRFWSKVDKAGPPRTETTPWSLPLKPLVGCGLERPPPRVTGPSRLTVVRIWRTECPYDSRISDPEGRPITFADADSA